MAPYEDGAMYELSINPIHDGLPLRSMMTHVCMCVFSYRVQSEPSQAEQTERGGEIEELTISGFTHFETKYSFYKLKTIISLFCAFGSISNNR